MNLSTNLQSGKILGILGGMGPYASLDFYDKLLKMTPAVRDQDHLHVILDSNAKVPSRVDAIIANGEDPVPQIISGLRMLEDAGADLIAIPCNTSHFYFSSYRSAITTPVVNMVESSVSHISTTFKDVHYVGVLASDASILSGMYQKELLRFGFQPLVPSRYDQESLVTKAIYGEKGLKAGYVDEENERLLLEACDNLVTRGAEVIIGACTEIPLVLSGDNCPVPFVDSSSVLAQVCVNAITLQEVFEEVVASSKVKKEVPSNMFV